MASVLPNGGSAVSAEFARGWTLSGIARGTGSMEFSPTSMVVDAEWEGFSWSRERRTIRYRELAGRAKRTKDGIEFPVTHGGKMRWVIAALAPDKAAIADELIAFLGVKYQYPECFQCHEEIDPETRKCLACGKLFSSGVRKHGLVLLGASLVVLAIGGALLGLVNAEWAQTAGGLAVAAGAIGLLVGVLTVAGGVGMRG